MSLVEERMFGVENFVHVGVMHGCVRGLRVISCWVTELFLNFDCLLLFYRIYWFSRECECVFSYSPCLGYSGSIGSVLSLRGSVMKSL